LSSDTSERIQSFEEFWPYYVGEHAKKSTRTLHFLGTTAAVGCAAAGLLLGKRWLLAVAPLCGYGPAWVSHFFIEKNRPATFTYPLWSQKADFVMWGKIALGEMDAEVERVLAARAKPSASPEPAAQDSPAAGDVLVN
jgi:hypothetical protein